MQDNKLIRIYAISLYNAAKSQDPGEVYDEIVGKVIYLTTNENIKKFFSTPNISIDRKIEFLQNKIQIQNINLLNFLKILITAGRFKFLGNIIEKFIRLYGQGSGIATAEIIVARNMTEGEKSKIENEIKDKVSINFECSYIIDPSIIGGYIFKIDNKMLDSSIRGELSRIKQKGKEIIASL